MLPQPRRVLVTRAAGQGSALAERLLALGLQPVLVPAIALAEPTTFAPLDEALARLEDFDWLVLTSANAVEAFAARAGQRVAGFSGKVAAIGTATAEAIRSAGLPPEVVPAKAVAESLAAALVPYALRPDGSPARFLLPRAEQGRDVLPETLTAAGAAVTVAPVYRTVVPETSMHLLRSLHEEPDAAPEAITFTSSSSARNLMELYRAAAVPWPKEALRVSIGPVTSATLTELGLPPHAEAPEANVSALAGTVLRCLLEKAP